MKLVGIDEAGKGPCIGPLVLCGLQIDKKKELELKLLGVKDSKKLTPLKRLVLAEKIKEIADDIEVIHILPEEIDNAISSVSSNLNLLEADKIAEIINKLKPDEIIVDCPSPNKKQFALDIQKKLKTKKSKIIAEHKADDNYPIVAAASIIAKVTRDNEINKLKKEYDVDFGSGYMSDEITQNFLKENWENSKYSSIIRRSWESWKKLKRDKNQKKLSEW